ncbi:caspase domain-containing protein [Lactarius indigo]|nr:caspase domain-containing protein [Lactarius indigo]
MEDIILVTGTHRTRTWTNVAFPGGQEDAQASFGVKMDYRGDIVTLNWQFSHERDQGAVFNCGPSGENLPEDQCIFIRGFRATRKFKIFPPRLRAAAGPNPDPKGYDEEPDAELIPIPTVPEYRDPLHILLKYIAEKAPPNCDMVLVHDDALARLHGIYDGTPLDGLRSDVVLSHVRNLKPAVYNARIDLSSAGKSASADTESVCVATLSNIFEKRSPSSTTSASQSFDMKTPLPREKPDEIYSHPTLLESIITGIGGYLREYKDRVPPQPETRHDNDHTRPPDALPHVRASDSDQPPPYYLPVLPHSEGSSYIGGPSNSVSSPASESPHPRIRNPSTWLSSPTSQPQPYNVDRQYQPYTLVAQSYSPYVRQKKALLVGIDYSTHPDPRFRLKWGVYDARVMARFLHESFHFEWSNIQILTDDQPGSLPTKGNIRTAMRWLVKGAQPGDSLFFFFSGHATQIKDMDGDELDGFDECMCAMDYIGGGQFPPGPDTPGLIVDDDINEIMVQPLPRGCRLTAVLDCVHSGTLLDLPFVYDAHGVLKPYNSNIAQQKSSPADVISLSACRDSENAFETRDGGALRCAFIDYMRNAGNRGTYLDIIRSLRAYMDANGLKQRPQLSSSHPIDTNQLFILSD